MHHYRIVIYVTRKALLPLLSIPPSPCDRPASRVRIVRAREVAHRSGMTQGRAGEESGKDQGGTRGVPRCPTASPRPSLMTTPTEQTGADRAGPNRPTTRLLGYSVLTIPLCEGGPHDSALSSEHLPHGISRRPRGPIPVPAVLGPTRPDVHSSGSRHRPARPDAELRRARSERRRRPCPGGGRSGARRGLLHRRGRGLRIGQVHPAPVRGRTRPAEQRHRAPAGHADHLAAPGRPGDLPSQAHGRHLPGGQPRHLPERPGQRRPARPPASTGPAPPGGGQRPGSRGSGRPREPPARPAQRRRAPTGRHRPGPGLAPTSPPPPWTWPPPTPC